ncbi:MAG: family 78 glycoside hydrolase catalytic domain, partial [Planctomycetaceae bacterium]|nr:family 78 glycoside hydrolase catalytic domain [Planctomycetaceae bacterium]
MKHIVFLLALFIGASQAVAATGVTPYDLRLEYLTAPQGIDDPHPRFSWKLKSSESAQSQTGYKIVVRKITGSTAETVWDTGEVKSSSQFVEYNGKPLEQKTQYLWSLGVLDKNGEAVNCSPQPFSTGILTPDGWKAKWIGLDQPSREEAADDATKLTLNGADWIWTTENAQQSASVGKAAFRKVFEVPADAKIVKAEFAFAADNGFTAYLNGTETGQGSNFKNAKVFNVTKSVKPGHNVLALEVSNHGESPNPAGLLGVLQIQTENGNPVIVKTGSTWKGIDGWDAKYAKTDFDDAAWKNAVKIADLGQGPWGEINKSIERPRPPARYLVKSWAAKGNVAAATAYIAGLGYYELEINGKKIGDHLLDPVLTDYDKQVPYVTYNIDPKAVGKNNLIGVILGNGRYYAPRTTDPTTTRTFGYPKLLFQLEVRYEDGSTETVVSDESWQLSTNGPIRDNNDYDGEIYDARKEKDLITSPSSSPSSWKSAELVDAPKGKLTAQMMPPMRVLEELKPISVTEIKPGVWIFDFGVNIVGSCRFKPLAGLSESRPSRRGLFNRRVVSSNSSAAQATLPEGTEFTLRFAETLIPDGPNKGQLYTANLRGALCRDIYIAGGKENAATEYAPKFTYHGFRYAELTFTGQTPPLNYKPNKETLTARSINTDLPVIGKLKTSNETVNSVFQIVLQGTRDNYLSIPTDCPQRDERQGWQGDRAGESLGEMMLFDGATLYSKWLNDIEDSQQDNGNLS